MSFAGRGSLRSDSPIYKSRTPLPDIPSGSTSVAATLSTATASNTINTNLGGGAGLGGGTSTTTSNYNYTSTTISSGSASPTRSLYRRSIVFDISSASGAVGAAGANGGNLIYPIRQPKGPEPGKMFTIREQKQLRDATMIKPAFV